MPNRPIKTPALLAILDGYGLAAADPANAVTEAATPNLDRYFAQCPHTTLSASGAAVGLPEGQMGNSEVGHLNIGAGRIVHQELTRIDRAIEDGTFFENRVLRDAISHAATSHKALHLMGLVSDGGVHSHLNHLEALVKMALDGGVSDVRIHAFLDGRDVAPASGGGYLVQLQEVCARYNQQAQRVRIATVMGRYFAMDRDNRWERVQKAWDALVDGVSAHRATDPVAFVEGSYDAGITDEFIEPAVITDTTGHASVISDGDTAVFFNFRPDRVRELTRAFVDEDAGSLVRTRRPKVEFVTLTDYDPTLNVLVAFPKELPTNVLADVIADSGLRQLHIAETEKYAHVTFFLNGGAEDPKCGEQRILVPSPKVATYDMQPEMSAFEVAKTLADAIARDAADVYIVNFANCDMVGHTGVLSAAVRAVEAVDTALGDVVDAVVSKGGFAMITADHGNAEQMVDAADGEAFTAHTLSPVPFILVDNATEATPVKLAPGGILADIAPTFATYMGIDAPSDWTGTSLVL